VLVSANGGLEEKAFVARARANTATAAAAAAAAERDTRGAALAERDLTLRQVLIYTCVFMYVCILCCHILKTPQQRTYFNTKRGRGTCTARPWPNAT